MPGADAPPLWSYAPADAYAAPVAPAEEVRGGLRRLLGRLRGAEPGPPAEEDLRPPAAPLLDRAAAPLSWEGARAALERALGTEGEAGPGVRVVVGPPGSGAAEVVAAWGRARHARELEAPGVEALLAGEYAGLERLAAAGGPVVVPRLESFYLLHASGFALLRRLTEALLGARRPALVGCGSWAWRFLGQTLGTEGLDRRPLALEPFDAARLRAWLSELAAPLGAALFRQSGSGAPVLATGRASGGEEALATFRQLAAESRGNPGVARALWRCLLRESGDVEPAADAAGPVRLWVEPPSRHHGPRLPAGSGRAAHWALRALALCGPLAEAGLRASLPCPTGELRAALAGLVEAGLVEAGGFGWRLSLAGYPAVREYLIEEGLDDRF